jgi:hypothetical protein
VKCGSDPVAAITVGSFSAQAREAALAWLAELGYGPNIGPDVNSPERASYGDVLLVERMDKLKAWWDSSSQKDIRRPTRLMSSRTSLGSGGERNATSDKEFIEIGNP